MQPLTGECEWYKLCSKGKYTARRCPTDRTGQRQMFNPTTNSCTDKVKMSVDSKCQSYKICLFTESVSMNGKWTELSCGPGQHFDQDSQKCIEEGTSTCGKYFQSFIFQKCFENCFFITNKIFVHQNLRHVMKKSVKMEGNVKKMGQTSTIAYVRLVTPEKTVNVIITISVKYIKISANRIVLNKNKN